MFKCVAVLACGVLVLAGLHLPGQGCPGACVLALLSVNTCCTTAPAAEDSKDDKDKPALSGAWARKGGELRIEFSDKDALKIFPHGEKGPLVIVCEYRADKEGRVKVKVTDLQ